MHWTQLAYVLILCVALASAFWRGQKPWHLLAIMSINFVATYELSGSVVAVSMADLFCASYLLGRGAKENMVSLIFALMVPVYILAWSFQWNNYTTYAIVDVLAYLQCAIIGGIGGGIVNRCSSLIDRFFDNLGVTQARVHAKNYIASAFRKAG